MNNRIKLSILTLLFSFTVLAQNSGIRGGANFSNLYVDDVSDENLKLGLNLGLWHKSELSSAAGIQTELNFSSKGAQVVYDNVLGNGKYRFNLNYLEVPVLFVGNLGPVQLHAGPYAAFLVGANIKDVDSDGDINNIESLDTNDFNRFDYGVAGGIGLDFASTQVGARYSYGLKEVGKSGSFAGEALENSKNAVFTLFIQFNL